MFDTPYQTTASSRTAFTQTALQRLRSMEINGELYNVPGPFSVVAVKPGANDVLPFNLPLTQKQIPTMEASVLIDARSHLRANGEVVRKDNWEHAVRMAELTAWWIKTEPFERSSLLSNGNYALIAYSSWISSVVGKVLSLDYTQIMNVRALAAVFYMQLHMSVDSIEGRDQDRILSRVARSLPRMDVSLLHSIVGDIPLLRDVDDFVQWVIEVLKSPRTDKLTAGVIFNAVGYAWGPAYGEQSRAAVEYPPIFVAMVYSSLIERSFSKNNMGVLLHKIVRSSEDKDFIKSINYILRG